ncbi:MAG: hybrid sensor histidine kinase/response regulator [Candidatus Kapaibacteriales bacterium]
MDYKEFSLDAIKGKKALIIDDNQENIKLLGTVLQKSDMKIAIARNGEKGVETAKLFNPDIIFMEVNMPGMDGYEATKLIKADPLLTDIPVVFVTARKDIEDMIKGYSVGGIDYLEKPFNRIQLIIKMVTYIELYENRKELKKLNSELKRADESKNKFVSLISHDLRSPLGGILGMMKQLVENKDLFTPEEIDETVDTLYGSLQKQYTFLEDLLKWGNMQIGRYKLSKSLLPLTLFFNHIKSLYELSAKNKSISLTYDIQENLQIDVDQTMFNSAIGNIYSNALKFTEEGGSISAKAIEHEGFAEITITDTGVGMMQSVADNLFDPAHFHTTKGTGNESGSGLGMLLVGEVVKVHGIEINAYSEQGKGTKIIIKIPLPEENTDSTNND